MIQQQQEISTYFPEQRDLFSKYKHLVKNVLPLLYNKRQINRRLLKVYEKRLEFKSNGNYTYTRNPHDNFLDFL